MGATLTEPAGARAFLDSHGWGGASLIPVTGDASFRRYFRVVDDERRAILMDAPPPEDTGPFLHIARWLHAQGFAAPEVFAVDTAQGLALIEDFGDDRFREAVDADPARAPDLYRAAVDVLVALHRVAPPEVEAYDHAALAERTLLLPDWYCPAVGIAPDLASYAQAWDAVLPLADAANPVLALRDFHAENLMLLGDGRIGLLDFQDAMTGHPAYDLVSLLQDARRDVEPAIEAAMLDHYRAVTGASEDFLTAYHVLGAQRNTRIVGVFTRLWRRDGKDRYPALCPRVWGYLERDLAHPALAPVKAWFDATIPPAKRGDPMLIGA
ncbi:MULTISPECIES: aminoglycoside phosphotransferase family protein [Sphingomonas]|uniref:aminoglycoside phosphotransferase family protein n=1 Tax=Sphingomonas TaxID=13687 RepID=UPI000B181770|nr:phosphotransferase [Sphingomonas sp. CCH10-B3]